MEEVNNSIFIEVFSSLSRTIVTYSVIHKPKKEEKIKENKHFYIYLQNTQECYLAIDSTERQKEILNRIYLFRYFVSVQYICEENNASFPILWKITCGRLLIAMPNRSSAEDALRRILWTISKQIYWRTYYKECFWI